MKKELLTLNNISRSFETRAVLKNISFSIDRHSITVILGPSGAGKTTLLDIVANILEPDQGTVSIDNNEKVHYIFQKPALLPWENVLDNVSFCLRLSSNNKSIIRKESLEALEKVGLIDHLKKRPDELSLGMQQRLVMARALTVKPTLVLMDEPFSSLDFVARMKMRDLTKNLLHKKTGASIILVTHDIEEAFDVADRIIVLDHEPAIILNDFVVAASTEGIKNQKEMIHNTLNESYHYEI